MIIKLEFNHLILKAVFRSQVGTTVGIGYAIGAGAIACPSFTELYVYPPTLYRTFIGCLSFPRRPNSLYYCMKLSLFAYPDSQMSYSNSLTVNGLKVDNYSIGLSILIFDWVLPKRRAAFTNSSRFLDRYWSPAADQVVWLSLNWKAAAYTTG